MKYHRRQCIHLLLQVILLTANCLAENLTLSINFKRRIFMTNGAFLSFTLDPATLLSTSNVLIEDIERYTNMVQGMTPAYVRFGGPDINSYIYDPANVDQDDMLFETYSILIHRWADDAGLNVIECISPRYIADKSETHSSARTSLGQLLFFNDRMDHNASWQLGYECQTRCDLSGADLGRYVADLRETLKAYPRYSDSLIMGPDIVAYETARQQQYLRDYLSNAGDALSVITWHPDFAGATVHGNEISVHSDNIAAEKDELYRVIGDIALNKPLWIAESKPEEYKHRYLGALTWTRRLGNVAKLGVEVVMRQFSEFSRPTPDYWVSFLHKALVGREVLEVKVQSDDDDDDGDDESHVHFYSQCTRPSALYEKGALTIFGVNLTPREVTASLKDFKIKTVHEYILSPDSAACNKMLAERVLLNGEPLDLINGMMLPDLSPEIVTNSNGLQLQLASGNIGFWVIPNAKVKACMHEEESAIEDIAAKKLLERRVTRQVNEQEKQEGENSSNSENRELHTKQERTKQRSNRTYLNHRRKHALYRRVKRLLQKSLQQKGNNETSNLQTPFTTFTREQNTIEGAEKQQNIDNKHFEGTKELDNEAEINVQQQLPQIQNRLKKHNNILLNRRSRAKVEHPSKQEICDINNADDIKTKNTGDIVVGMNKKFKEKFGGIAKKLKINTIDRIEKYFNVFHKLLENNKLTRKNIEDNQMSVHDNLTNKKRYTRDLSRRTVDLKDRIRRKIRRKDDDKKETSSVAYDLTNLYNRKSGFHDLSRLYRSRRDNPQYSVFSIQERGRTTRDVDRIFRKRSRFDDVRDHVNERKLKRKDDFRREGSWSSSNPRIIDSDENGSNDFFRRDPVRGFPKGDVFVTTGVSAERRGSDYDYVEDDEDDSKSVSKVQEEESTVDEADDQRDYTPNEFYENVNLPSAKIREDAKNYDELYEIEFVLDKQENKKDNHDSVTDDSQPLDQEEVKRIKERSIQQLVDYNLGEEGYNRDLNHEIPGSHSGLSTSSNQLTEIPSAKYDFANYQTSEASPEAAKTESKFSSFFYQSALASPVKNDYGNFHVSSIRPNVEYMKNSINNEAFHKRDERSGRKKWQVGFTEEMVKEDPDNAKDCHCRVIRARNSPKKRYGNRVRRDMTSAEAEDANVDLARSTRNMPIISVTKEEFDRIMTGEILPSTSVSETDSDYNKRDTTTVRKNKSHRRTNEAIQTTDIVSTSTMPPSETTDISAQRTIMEEQEFFRAQPSPTSSEIKETPYDFVAITDEIPSRDEESRQESSASVNENAKQVSASLNEETQDLEEKTQRVSSDAAATEKGKAKGRRCNYKVSSKPDEETTERNRSEERIAQEHVTAETSRQAMRKTTDFSKSNKLKTRKESKEARRSENEPSSSGKRGDRARMKEENSLKITTSLVQNPSKSELKDPAKYEKHLVSRRGQMQKLRERRQRPRNDPTKIVGEQTRNLRRREAWERFCENNDVCRLIDQETLLRFLLSEIETRLADENKDDDKGDDSSEENEEDRYLAVEFVPERCDSLRDRTYSRANVKYYPEYNSRYHFLQDPKVVEIEQEPVTLPAPSDRKIFAIDPSTYRGGEPVLKLHEEYLEPAPKYSSKIKFQTPAPRWSLKDFYRTPLRPAEVYRDQQIFKPYDSYRGREYARKSQTADEGGNAVVLYLLDKHRQYDRQYVPEKLAERPRLYLNVLDRRDIDQVAKSETTNDSNNDDARSAVATTRKVGLPKKIDEKYRRTNEYTQHEELGNHRGENVGQEIDRSHEINDEIDNTDTDSNMEARNVEEGTVDDGGSETSGLLDTLSIIPRSRRNTEDKMAVKFQEKARQRTADAITEPDHDRYICMKKENSEEISSEESIPLYQLTRLSSNAVLFRKPNDYAISSSRNFDQQEEKQSSKYVVLMPDKIKDVHPSHEMFLGAKNPEKFSKDFGVSSWLDQYLPKRITDAMIKYLNDVSSEEFEYADTLIGSDEENSDEEVSYSSDYSDESIERKRKTVRNVADQVDCESREEDQQYGVKSKESHLKMKDRTRTEELRAFMPLPEENEKTKRQRRQAGIDKELMKSILIEDPAEDENEYYLQRNSINEKDTSTDYPHSQKDGKIHDNLLEDFAKSRWNVITSTENEGNIESSENSIAKGDRKSPSFMEETIPKLESVIMDGLEKAKDLTESVEQFVDNFEENFNKTSAMDEETSSTNKTSESTGNPFHLAMMNIKKFLTLFAGIF